MSLGIATLKLALGRVFKEPSMPPHGVGEPSPTHKPYTHPKPGGLEGPPPKIYVTAPVSAAEQLDKLDNKGMLVNEVDGSARILDLTHNSEHLSHVKKLEANEKGETVPFGLSKRGSLVINPTGPTFYIGKQLGSYFIEGNTVTFAIIKPDVLKIVKKAVTNVEIDTEIKLIVPTTDTHGGGNRKSRTRKSRTRKSRTRKRNTRKRNTRKRNTRKKKY